MSPSPSFLQIDLQGVSIPVTCKIRIFPGVIAVVFHKCFIYTSFSSYCFAAELEKTLEYARMVERSGCSILAVHGRTREQKDLTATRADWDAIKAVKEVRSGL